MGTGGVLLGREPELRVLAGCLDRALAGERRLVLCGGEPGIGKTRLAEELAVMARDRGMAPVWGRATKSEGAPPYWPWRQVWRAAAGGPAVAAALGITAELAVVAPEAFAGLATYRDTEPELEPVLADLLRDPGATRLTLAGLGRGGRGAAARGADRAAGTGRDGGSGTRADRWQPVLCR
jgi:hypothetical protein